MNLKTSLSVGWPFATAAFCMFAVAACAILAPIPRPVPSIIRGPYLQCATTNNVVLRWRTDTMGPSVVRYGLSPANLDKRAFSAGQLTEHVVLLTNLVPETKYYYTIGTNDVPILATLTNNVLSARTTNGALILTALDRTQISKSTNGTFVISPRRNVLVVSNSVTGFSASLTNRSLVLVTTNYSLLITLSNRALHVSSTNTWRNVGTSSNRSGKVLSRELVVATTNTILLAADESSSFHTPPPIGSERPVRIWVLGDPGTRRPAQSHVREGFLKYNGNRDIDAWLLLGDNAYTAGTDLEYQGSIFQAYPALLKKWVLWPSLGNHDAGSANSPTQSGIYFDIFTLPTLGQGGGIMSGTEAYYSFDCGNVHCIAIDSANSDRSTNGAMYQWMQRDLSANKQDWCIAFCHHPPYTKGSHDSDREKDSDGIMRDMRSIIVPLLERGGVDILLTGHSHAYERSFLLDSHYTRSTILEEDKSIKSDSDGRLDGWGAYHKATRGPAPHEGTLYIVAGSGGQVSGGSLLHPAMYAGLNVHGSLVLDVHGPKLGGSFIDTNGLIRDYFAVTKGHQQPLVAQGGAPAFEEIVDVAGEKVPARLRAIFDPKAPFITITNAKPTDGDLLIKLYDENQAIAKTALTWALAWTGDADATVKLMGFVTNKLDRAAWPQNEENLRAETIQALGFLATRYEAVFVLLKKGIEPDFWQQRRLGTPRRSDDASRLLALACIRGLGLSGRPEAELALLPLQRKEATTDWASRCSIGAGQALAYCARFQKLGSIEFQRSVLRESPPAAHVTSLH